MVFIEASKLVTNADWKYAALQMLLNSDLHQIWHYERVSPTSGGLHIAQSCLKEPNSSGINHMTYNNKSEMSCLNSPPHCY